jgi:hypothetical protein
VLPEYHLTSWVPDDPRFAEIAQTAYSYVAKYQELAKELKVNLVPGTIVTVDPTLQAADGDAATKSTADANDALLNIAPFGTCPLWCYDMATTRMLTNITQ